MIDGDPHGGDMCMERREHGKRVERPSVPKQGEEVRFLRESILKRKRVEFFGWGAKCDGSHECVSHWIPCVVKFCKFYRIVV